MKNNSILMTHIKSSEALKLKAYKDPVGIWTCGYGCTGKNINASTVWTQEKAEEELTIRVDKALSIALALSPILHEAVPKKLYAVADFIFNCGQGAYKRSTLKKYIDAGNWQKASEENSKWVYGRGEKLPGLVKRRAVTSKWLVS